MEGLEGIKKEQVTVTLVVEGSMLMGRGRAPFQNTAEETAGDPEDRRVSLSRSVLYPHFLYQGSALTSPLTCSCPGQALSSV